MWISNAIDAAEHDAVSERSNNNSSDKSNTITESEGEVNIVNTSYVNNK